MKGAGHLPFAVIVRKITIDNTCISVYNYTRTLLSRVLKSGRRRNHGNRKVRLNQHTNLLELEEHMYPLVDVDTPNVFRNLFHYDEIPKIAFNDRIVPHNMPDEIWITDTTFRDGQQSRAPYTTEQIVTIYDYFHRLGGPNGKIRQSEFSCTARRSGCSLQMSGERISVSGSDKLDPCQ